MLQAGIPIIASLNIVASTAGNTVIKEVVIEPCIPITKGGWNPGRHVAESD